jgi:hypothetical protein
MKANLYREYPAPGAVIANSVPVAIDGTWAFDGLAAWGHYFVQIEADFGGSVAIATLVGPLPVPSTGSAVAVAVRPVQLTVLQESPGGSEQLVSAIAFVFDPQTGAPTTSATVAIDVAGTPQPMVPTPSAGGTIGYLFTAPAGTAAQSTYTITTALPGASMSTWQLVAPASLFSPLVSAPVGGATLPAGQPLTVAWPPQPADTEAVAVYTKVGGAWTAAYESPPVAADGTQITIPANVVAAGPLLLNAQFFTAGCAATSDGCVTAAAVVAVQVTAQ